MLIPEIIGAIYTGAVAIGFGNLALLFSYSQPERPLLDFKTSEDSFQVSRDLVPFNEIPLESLEHLARGLSSETYHSGKPLVLGWPVRDYTKAEKKTIYENIASGQNPEKLSEIILRIHDEEEFLKIALEYNPELMKNILGDTVPMLKTPQDFFDLYSALLKRKDEQRDSD